MTELVEDVLALAETSGDVEVSTMDLETVVRESWETARTGAAPAALEVESLGTVEADPGRLRRLLENLFANAVEHAGPEVTVTVGPLSEGDDPPGFYVADDGPGIPPERREEVFERGVTTAEGTGLGLDIVRRAAAAHDWEVVLAESERGGARFEIHGSDALPESAPSSARTD